MPHSPSPSDQSITPGSGSPAGSSAKPQSGLKPVLSLWALVLFGLAFVGPTAPYTFFGVGAAQSHGHFAMVYLIAMIAVSFTAASYGKMAAAFPEAGSTYAYASKAIHPMVGYLAGWVMILDYILMPMLCVIIVGATSHKLLPSVPYSVWVIFTATAITALNLRGIEMTSLASTIFNVILGISIIWFLVAAVWALTHGVGRGTLISLEPFYSAQNFSIKAVMAATPVAVLSFLGFDGISTLAEDAKDPQKNISRATILVCFIDSMTQGAKQPYHFAENLGLEEAERHLQKCAAVSQRLAVQAIREMLDGVTARKYRVLGCAMLLASGRALPSLQKILASHALIHTAEGEFFRNVVSDACEACHIPVMRFRERELNERANTTFGNRARSVRQHISELRKTVGSPWTQDEKTAALAALIVSETNRAGLTPLQ